MYAPRRRWIQFSLQTFLVVLTAFAVWLAVVVDRARKQQNAVRAIEALGGAVVFDWQHVAWQDQGSHETPEGFSKAEHGFRPWLRRHAGKDLFQEVTHVSLAASPAITDADVLNSIPALQCMRGLKYVTVFSTVTRETRKELKVALPDCEVLLYVAADGPNSHGIDRPIH